MDMIKIITTTLLLTATAATAQHSGDPQGFHQDFDFLAAWGVDRGPDAAMAIIPNDDCVPSDETGLCARYQVGASFVSEGGVSPSFEASGVISDLTIWSLPAEHAYWAGGLEDFQAPDGSFPFTGEVVMGDAYFAGRLSTPTGYDEFVTGIITVMRFDFESPERISLGSMILEPLDEWEFAADGFAAIDALVASVWNDAVILGHPDQAPGEDDCWKKYQEDKAACHAKHSECLQDSNLLLDECLDDIGFWDRVKGAGVGAAAGGAGGGGTGALIGSILPGVGTVAGGTVGGFAGGLVGGIAGFCEGPSQAKNQCYNKHRTRTTRCDKTRDRCLKDALDGFLECRNGDD